MIFGYQLIHMNSPPSFDTICKRNPSVLVTEFVMESGSELFLANTCKHNKEPKNILEMSNSTI